MGKKGGGGRRGGRERRRERERGQGELYQQAPDQPPSGDLLVFISATLLCVIKGNMHRGIVTRQGCPEGFETESIVLRTATHNVMSAADIQGEVHIAFDLMQY